MCVSVLWCAATAAGVAASDVQRNLELRCVLDVVRHGDRTPKQKMKVTVTQVRGTSQNLTGSLLSQTPEHGRLLCPNAIMCRRP